MSQTATCRAPGCSAIKLCDAHIVPRGIARTLSLKRGGNRAVRAHGSARTRQQLGDFDSTILCADCDNKLGEYDNYLVRFCRSLPTTRFGRFGASYRVTTFDGTMFIKAILAILWRASLSNRPSWADVNLTDYQAPIADILFGGAPPDRCSDFELVVGRLFSADIDAERFYSMPVAFESSAFRAFGFALGGFHIVAKFDPRPLTGPIVPFVIRPTGPLHAYMLPLEETAEYGWLREAAARERKRRL